MVRLRRPEGWKAMRSKMSSGFFKSGTERKTRESSKADGEAEAYQMLPAPGV